MKRNVISSHGRTRTNSTVSSFGSDSGSPELKRQTSKKSMAGFSTRSDRPESIQIFGKSLFSRGSRKSKTASGRSSSMSLHQRDSQYADGRIEEEPSKKHLISGPYNFQHVIHTAQGSQSGVEVKSRGSSLDNEQTLSGRPHASSISDSDYMSDAITETAHSIAEEVEGTPRPQRRTFRKSVSPINVAPRLRSSQSHDSVRNAPPRPPRSPMMPMPLPGGLPPRTSSRTPSMIWDEYDPLASTSLERPHYASGFRRPQAFHLPLSPPLPAENMAPVGDYFSQPSPVPARPQDNVGWPFAPQPSPSESGSQLADVPEEEELTAATRRQNRLSTASIRASRSVPNMQSRSRADSRANASDIPLPPTPTAFLGFAEQAKIQQPIKLNLDSFDSWEDDIDYCYEHEVEADCEYNWERTSIDTEIARKDFHDSACSTGEFDFATDASPRSVRSVRRVSNEYGLPDPYVSPPSPSKDVFQIPEFDFASQFSTGSLTSSRKRESYKLNDLLLAAPRNEEFQESQGFTLSPSLLIPRDYADANQQYGYEHQQSFERFASFAGRSRSSYGSESNRLSDPPSMASVRSSRTSHTDGLRGSGGSSSSLVDSFHGIKAGHESVLLERSAEVAQSQRNSGNLGRCHSGSVSSVISNSSMLSCNPFDAYIEREDNDITPLAQNRLSDGGAGEEMTQSLELARQEAESRLLPPSPSPCAQSPMEEQRKMMHGRKGSVPLLNAANNVPVQRAAQSPKATGRARASTVGGRAKSYGLFPAPVQTPTQPFPVMGNAF